MKDLAHVAEAEGSHGSSAERLSRLVWYSNHTSEAVSCLRSSIRKLREAGIEDTGALDALLDHLEIATTTERLWLDKVIAAFNRIETKLEAKKVRVDKVW